MKREEFIKVLCGDVEAFDKEMERREESEGVPFDADPADWFEWFMVFMEDRP